MVRVLVHFLVYQTASLLFDAAETAAINDAVMNKTAFRL